MTTLDQIELALRRAVKRTDDRAFLSQEQDTQTYMQFSECLRIVADELRIMSARLKETETEN